MSPAQVQAMINTSLASFSNKAQFGVSSVQHHTHNNTDSPKISYKNLTNTPMIFAGVINSDGTNSVIPNQWTSAEIDTGVYKITHNLGTTSYAAVICNSTSDPGDNGIDRPSVILQTAQYFEVEMYASGAGHNVAAPFNFVLFVQT